MGSILTILVNRTVGMAFAVQSFHTVLNWLNQQDVAGIGQRFSWSLLFGSLRGHKIT